MNRITWSYSSLLLYITTSLVATYGIRKAKLYGTKIGIGRISINVGYVLFFCSFWLLAVLRSVENGLGGSDIWNYLRMFEGSSNSIISIDMLLQSGEVEPLFLLLNKCIYYVNSNPRFYLAVMYGIIVSAYIMFIKAWCPKNISYIPLIVLIFPFLKSFCTLRSSIAISFILIGLCVFKRNKVLGFLITLLSLFIHISAILYIPFILFYELYRKKIKKMDKYHLCIFFLVYLILVYFASIVFKKYFGSVFITGNYTYYVDVLRGNNFIERIPLYFMQIILAIVLLIFNKRSYIFSVRSEYENENDFILVCCIYDILVIPAAYMFGIWRANEFFYLPRLIMWGIIIFGICKNKFKKVNSIFVIKTLACLISFGWLVFRISREFEELGIMPYQFFIH